MHGHSAAFTPAGRFSAADFHHAELICVNPPLCKPTSLPRTSTTNPRAEVLLDVAAMCASARSVSINVRALGLPVPPPRLQQHQGAQAATAAASEPSAAWSVGAGASIWDLGVPMPAPGVAVPGGAPAPAPTSAADLKRACLARVQRWVLDGAAEYVEILCKHVRYHYTEDGGGGQLAPLAPRQLAAVAAESWAAAADALALDLANNGASSAEVEAWVAAAEVAYREAQAGGAEEAGRTELFEVRFVCLRSARISG